MGDLISYMIQQSSCSKIHKTRVEVTSSIGVTAVTSESNMGGDRVPKRVKRGLPPFVFCAASSDIHCSNPVPASVAIAGRKEGYVD